MKILVEFDNLEEFQEYLKFKYADKPQEEIIAKRSNRKTGHEAIELRQEIMKLRDQGYNFREIGEKLGIRQSTAYQYYWRVKENKPLTGSKNVLPGDVSYCQNANCLEPGLAFKASEGISYEGFIFCTTDCLDEWKNNNYLKGR